MAWQPLKSSMLSAMDYDAQLRILHVRFVRGEVYDYRDVPPDVAEGLASAPSAGRYFNEAIRGRYRPL